MVGTGFVKGRGACTLLGPEGSAAGRGLQVFLWVVVRGCGFLALMPRQTGSVAGGVRLYFENYTVDASILKKRTQIDISVAHVISSL